MGTLLDGKKLAGEIKSEIKERVDDIKNMGKRPPHLAAVLVGDNPASQAYVRNKVRSCEQVGFDSTLIKKSDTISEEELLNVIEELNDREDIDGFIVQLPLPDHINDEKITLAIHPAKDVDGFHPANFGRMALGLDAYLPATPNGILEIFKRYEIPTEGKHCVVVGRSNIVGKPMSILMGIKGAPGNCTVTLVHSRTKDLKAETLRADILIAAIGRPDFITADMVKEGAVVIDVGINRVDDSTRKRGYRLVGDVDFENVSAKAEYITPVPGGVGPLTVASLISNTLKAYLKEVYG